MNDFHYIGKELELFQEAKNWKNYFSSFILPYIRGRVLEVGAGIGANTALLCQEDHPLWLCLEPDGNMVKILESKIQEGNLPACCQVRRGFLQDLPLEETFDTILYIDVLEHIEEDRQEFEDAVKRLSPGGRIIILVPAYPILFSDFDKAIGHYRRYTRKTLFNLPPSGVHLLDWRYLDSLGALLLWAKQRIRPSKYPTATEIILWDKFFMPFSKILDFFTAYHLGKTLVGVWEKGK